MARALACLVVLGCLGVVPAQPKGKDAPPTRKVTKAKLVLLDVKKKRLTVEIGGIKKEFAVDNDTLEAVENIDRGVSDRSTQGASSSQARNATRRRNVRRTDTHCRGFFAWPQGALLTAEDGQPPSF
jgi:hypothetical protein